MPVSSITPIGYESAYFCRLDPVLYHMRQGRLDDLARMIRLLGRLIPERRPEAVRQGRDLEPCEQSTQMLFDDQLPVADGEDNRTAVAEHPGLVEYGGRAR